MSRSSQSVLAGAALLSLVALPQTATAQALTEAAQHELAQALLPSEAREAPRERSYTRVSLEEAVKQALARNPSVQVAQTDIQRVYGLMRQVRAASLPTLTLNATYTRLDNDRIFGTGDSQRLVAGANQFGGNLTAAVPVVAPTRWMQWLHAADNVKLAELSAADVRRQVAAATARAYLTVVAQTRIVEVSERARDAARAHHDYAAQRLRGGVGSRLDEVRAAQELDSSEAQLSSARVGLLRTREALGVLMGAEEPIDSAGEPDLRAQTEALAAPAELLVDAPLLRADLRLSQARAWAAARLVRHSFTDFLPTVTATFAPFFQEPPSLAQPTVGWQAQLNLNWALFDGGLRYGARQERWALYNQAKYNVAGATRQARSEVRTALESVSRAVEASTSARHAAERATEALELSTLAYRAGATTNLEVIDAERRARDAATVAIQAEDSVRQSRLDLLIASGQFPQ